MRPRPRAPGRQGLMGGGAARPGGGALPLAESWAGRGLRGSARRPLARTPPPLCTFLAATAKRAGPGRTRPDRTAGAMRLLPLLRTVLWAALLGCPLRGGSGLRHDFYWNSSNPR